jgi:hypothetical protein
MKSFGYLFLIVYWLNLQVCHASYMTNAGGDTSNTASEDNVSTNQRSKDQDEINISPKCAAVLLAGTGIIAGTGAMLTPTALCSILGFCPTGVAGGSLASWWQSTLPLVSKGSLFAKLQSIAMRGSGPMTALQTVIGLEIGFTGVSYINAICKAVDSADPYSAKGQLVELTYHTVSTVLETPGKTKELFEASEKFAAGKEVIAYAANAIAQTATDAMKIMEERCASSESCASGKEKVHEMINSASQSSSSLWNAAREGGVSGMTNEAEKQCASSEACTAAKDMATETAWSLWNAAKVGASAVAAQIGEYMEEPKKDHDVARTK